LKILLIHPHIFVGGAEKAIVYLAYHLNQLGHKVAICSLSIDLDKLPSIAKKVHYIFPDKRITPPKPNSTIAAIHSVIIETRELFKLIHDYQDDFDILNPCNFPAYWSTYAYRNCKPIVWISSEVFGAYDIAKDAYDRSIFFRMATKVTSSIDKYIVRKSIDKIITCSELNQRLIKKRYGLDAIVIPTAVDYNFFNINNMSNPNIKEIDINNSYILLHVGTFVKRKNQILSIRALHLLKKEIPNVKLILIGKGPWEAILRSEVKRLELDKDVIFAGHVSEEELRTLYHISNVNIFPVEEQTYGLVPLEALACGKISLVSKNSGVGILMKKLGIGYLINPSVEDIVKGVLEIWKHPEKFEENIAKGRAYIRENINWEKYAMKIMKVYEEVYNTFKK
jgi:glycosyltransferase involved in cell wall biosynthesis